jgi:two-component sensor histidine kinase
MLRTVQSYSFWLHLAITGAMLAAACLFQLPLEREVPGEPFLLFFLVVVAATLAFGTRIGFVTAGMSTVLALLFFEPVGTFALQNAADLVSVELYALLAGVSVVAFSRLRNALTEAHNKAETLKRLEESKSILLRELAHGVSNNFAAIAALISLRSGNVSDGDAKAVLDEAIEQVRVMGRVHQRLRAGNRSLTLDSRAFLEELCKDLEVSMAKGRAIAIECNAASRELCADQATSVGLIVNELVTNALKHAFPRGRAGRIYVGLEVGCSEMCLTVEDNGIGFGDDAGRIEGMGRELVRGLARNLGGELKVTTSASGSSFRLSVPYGGSSADLSSPPHEPAVSIH